MENEKEQNRKPKEGNFWSETLRFVLISTVFVVLPIRLYVAQPFIVSGESMSPSFETGEYLIVDQLSYYLREPARGEVVVFRYPVDPSKYFIKRIIGLPGEKLELNAGKVTIEKEGTTKTITLIENYVKKDLPHDTKISLNEDEYFVMGDNRQASSDSRNWGPVKRRLLIGRALVRLLPIARAEVLPAKAPLNEN